MKRVIIGRFGQSHGVKGWIKVHSYTDPFDNLLKYRQWQVQHDGEWQVIEVAEAKRQGNGIIAKLSHCNDPELARTYRNDAIAVSREQMQELPPYQYYWVDLIGLRVVNEKGIELGFVDHLFETGANDVMVVIGEKRHLIPYIKNVIRQVDLSQQIIQVIWDADF